MHKDAHSGQRRVYAGAVTGGCVMPDAGAGNIKLQTSVLLHPGHGGWRDGSEVKRASLLLQRT